MTRTAATLSAVHPLTVAARSEKAAASAQQTILSLGGVGQYRSGSVGRRHGRRISARLRERA
jgi:hypothetical protein